MKANTEQMGQKRDEKGRIIGGAPPNGFNKNPQNISPGGWKKEDTISYQYNSLMRMTPEELTKFKPKTVAQKIALQRVKNAIKESGLPDTKEITDRTEGKAQQPIDMTTNGESMNAFGALTVDELRNLANK